MGPPINSKFDAIIANRVAAMCLLLDVGANPNKFDGVSMLRLLRQTMAGGFNILERDFFGSNLIVSEQRFGAVYALMLLERTR